MVPQFIADAFNFQKRFIGCQNLRKGLLIVETFHFVEVLIRIPGLPIHELVVGQIKAGVLQIIVIQIILGAIA
jgi:hypothetical protein